MVNKNQYVNTNYKNIIMNASEKISMGFVQY